MIALLFLILNYKNCEKTLIKFLLINFNIKMSKNLTENQQILHDIAMKQQIAQQDDDQNIISDIDISLSEPKQQLQPHKEQQIQQPQISTESKKEPEPETKIKFSDFLLEPILILLLFIIILHPKSSELLMIDSYFGSYCSNIETMNLIKRGMLIVIIYLASKYAYQYFVDK